MDNSGPLVFKKKKILFFNSQIIGGQLNSIRTDITISWKVNNCCIINKLHEVITLKPSSLGALRQEVSDEGWLMRINLADLPDSHASFLDKKITSIKTSESEK